MTKTFTVLTLILLSGFNASAAAAAAAPVTKAPTAAKPAAAAPAPTVVTVPPSAEPVIRTSLQLVACPVGVPEISVYTKDGKPLTTLKPLEQVNRFAGWGANEITLGKLKLSRIQIPAKPTLGDIYVDTKSLATADGCPLHVEDPKLKYAPVLAAPGDDDDDEEVDPAAAPVYEAAPAHELASFSIDSSACCKFPLKTKPNSFLSGIGRFGAGRKKGRIHGGADLYGQRKQAVYSVATGTVIRAPYAFKSGTLAVDVRHRGGFVVRYGEISGKPFGLRVGTQLKEGQQVGEMKYVPGAPSAMTHFELYRGNKTGKLSQPGNKYSRRGDIVNPTPYLVKWEKKK